MSDVFNIDSYRPQRTDRFFVDTNVWFWSTYAASREMDIEQAPRQYQLLKYPEFIERVLDVGASLFHCPLTYAELANIIERTEFQIYCNDNRVDQVSRKDYRKIKDQRVIVLNEIKVAWASINSMSKSLSFTINDLFINNTHEILNQSTLDPYDGIFYRLIMDNDITNILTDDSDFRSVAQGNIFTANSRMLGR